MSISKLYFLIIVIIISYQQANSQVYFGISGGAALIEQNNIEFLKQSYDVKGVTFTRKLMLGYQFHYLGIELGHRLMGSVFEETDIYVLNTNKKGWEVSMKGKYSFGNIAFLAKGGVLLLSNRNNYILTYNHKKTYRQKIKTEDFLWGIGFEWTLSQLLGLRLEFESILQNEARNYNTLTLGTIFTIKQKSEK